MKKLIKPKKHGNIYDAFVKEMFCQIYTFAAFLLHYADPKFVKNIDLRTLQLGNTHFFDGKGNEKIADLVFHCKQKNSDETATVVIVFEHYSNDLFYLPLKLLTYLVGFWNWYISDYSEGRRKLLPSPYFIVLRTGKRPLKSKKQLCDIIVKFLGASEKSIPDFDYDIVDLPAIPFEEITGGPELEVVLGILKKHTEGHEEEYAEAFAPVNKIKDSEQCTSLVRKALQLTTKVFAARGKKLDREQITKSLHQVLKGREKNMLPTIFEELEAKGKAEGKVEGKAEAILQILESRFQPAPASVEKKLAKITDTEQLTVLLERALYCDSIKAFSESLK